MLFLIASGLLAAMARYFADPVNARMRMVLASGTRNVT
jgi:hypothetical protein